MGGREGSRGPTEQESIPEESGLFDVCSGLVAFCQTQ